MTQITHCPQCATAFQVSPEQLQQANGWVRCGRCQTMFEAHRHWGMATQPDADEPAVSVEMTPVASPQVFDAAVPAPEFAPEFASAPSFMKSSTRLWAWRALAVLGGLLMLLQAVLWQRDALAAQNPAWRVPLSALCAPLGCRVGWPREPDALVIESSSLSRHEAGGYVVQLHLKNNQSHPVATPALELTLTDLNDEVVLRRVLGADELALNDHIDALRDADTTLHFELDSRVGQRVAGFRALIFYP